ncbi:hypothetical protein TELCIR_01598 [Teladorsagia circumcincta]|uniref:Uncharacterized protein n=1 Tax=Teladorsagia circumcincta TaxID=45464 RepID=A0A2G9V1I2_TELCI|nr:hypothetical protein TELCIR_01598 [Teladorsagia circumcincta]
MSCGHSKKLLIKDRTDITAQPEDKHYGKRRHNKTRCKIYTKAGVGHGIEKNNETYGKEQLYKMSPNLAEHNQPVKTKGKNEEQKTRRINILGYEDEDYDEDDVYFDHDCQPTGTPRGRGFVGFPSDMVGETDG